MSDNEQMLLSKNKHLMRKVANLEEDIKMMSRQVGRYQKEMMDYHSMFLEMQKELLKLKRKHEMSMDAGVDQ